MFNAWSVRLPSSGPFTADHNLSGTASSLGCRPRPPTRTGLRTEGMPTYELCASHVTRLSQYCVSGNVGGHRY